MRTYDFSPVAFDHWFRPSFRPRRNRPARRRRQLSPLQYRRLADDRYQISIAIAGFSSDEISVTAEQNVVTIEGSKAERTEHDYLYRGISARPFKRQFNLADYVQVKSAAFENGLLRIELVREIPEAMKPRRIRSTGRAVTCNSLKAKPHKRHLSRKASSRPDRRAGGCHSTSQAYRGRPPANVPRKGG
jgi:molecular chaperone IbpA